MRNHFASILGQEYALDNENDLLAYSYDASGKEGKAKLVVFPSNEEEVRKILTYANRTSMPIDVRGLGCNTLGMVVPDNSIVMDMARFDRVKTLNLKEGWVEVESGVVAAELQKTLRKHGYELPVNPKSNDVSTIGALIATNAMDRRSHKFGRMKDNVLQLEIIDGTGKHYINGNKSFIGLEGVGAIIVRAKIRIRPIIEQTTSSIIKLSTLTDVMAKVDELKEDLSIISMEYLNPRMSMLAGLNNNHYLLIEYDGDKGDIVNMEQQQALWSKRDDAWDYATKEGFPFIEDCYAQGEALYDVLSWCEDIDIPLVAHIGQGVVHPFMDREDASDFYDLLKTVGADASGQFGYGLVKKEFVPKDVKDKILLLKDEYDYNDILGRGKLYDYK